jgi:hypothetical protein
MNYYVLKYETGDFVSIDRQSGGYPSRTSSLQEASMFNQLDKANSVAGMYPNLNMRPCRVVVEEIT